MRKPVNFIAIGEIVAPHGLRGEVRVIPLTDSPERFLGTAEVLLGTAQEEPARDPVPLEEAKLHGQFVLVKLAGVDSVEAAERLRGRFLYVPRAAALPLPEGRYYRFDLEGLAVVTEEGAPLGELVEVVENPANDLLVVRPPGGKGDIFLPALKSVVREVDLAGGRMVVRLLPGMFDADEEDRE